MNRYLVIKEYIFSLTEWNFHSENHRSHPINHQWSIINHLGEDDQRVWGESNIWISGFSLQLMCKVEIIASAITSVYFLCSLTNERTLIKLLWLEIHSHYVALAVHWKLDITGVPDVDFWKCNLNTIESKLNHNCFYFIQFNAHLPYCCTERWSLVYSSFIYIFVST